jgi:fibronectin-binding autotransporter adhesin
MVRRELHAALIAILLILSGQTSRAGSATWSAAPASGDWNTAANWVPMTVPNGLGDTGTFDFSNTTSVSVGNFIEVNSILFNPSASAFTITVSPPTSTISLDITGAGIINNSGNIQTFVVDSANGAAALAFFNSATAGSSTNFIGKGSTNGGINGGYIQFYGNSTADHGIFTADGSGSQSGNGGAVQFRENSTAANGSFTINGGQVSGANGGFAQFLDSSSAGNATLIANGGSGANAQGGTIEFASTTAANTAGNATLIANGGSAGGEGGVICFNGESTGGTARVEVFGNGRLELVNPTNSNLFHNAPGLTIGSLEGTGNVFLGNRNLNLTVGANNLSTAFSGVIQGDGSLSKIGTGSFTLAGANTYTGATTVDAGRLTIDSSTGSLNGTTGTALTMGGGTFDYDNTTSSTTKSQNMGALTFSAGESTVQTTRTAAQNVMLTFSSLAGRPAGVTRNFVVSGGTNGTSNSIVLTGAAAGFVDQGTFFGGSNYAFMNATSSYVRGINYNGDAGAATSSGATTLASTSFQQITGAVTAQNTATFTTLNISGDNDFTLAGGQTVTVNGILKSGNTAGGATISGGTAIQAANNAELVIRTDGASDVLSISTNIQANGTNALTKSGAGTLTLSVSNSYTGGTYITAGTLVLNGTNGSSTFGSGLGTGTVTINGGQLQFAPTGTQTAVTNFANSFVLNGGTLYANDGNEDLATGTGATINVTAPTTLQRQWGSVANKSLNLDGILQGSAALTLQGSGGNTTEGSSIWINNGSNTYNGTIRVNANTGSGGFAMVDGANNALEFATVNLSGIRTAGSTDAALLYGVQFKAGVTAPAFGALQGSGNINLQDLAGTPAAVGLNVGSNNATTTFSGSLSGPGSLTKAGNGAMTLSGANTYTGPTKVNAGELVVNGSITSAVTVNHSTLSGSGTIGALTVNSGSMLSPGSSPGILNIHGNLLLTLGSTYLVDLNGTALGTNYDQTNVSGVVTLGNATLSLNLGVIGHFTPAPGDMFTIINDAGSDAVTGTFNGLPEGALFRMDGSYFTISYQGGDGNDVVLTTAVPEPGIWMLLALGGVCFPNAARGRDIFLNIRAKRRKFNHRSL